MAIVGLLVVLGALALLVVTVPFAIAAAWAAAGWAWESGFLVALGAAAVVLPVLVLLDPRERKSLHQARAHLLQALRRRAGK